MIEQGFCIVPYGNVTEQMIGDCIVDPPTVDSARRSLTAPDEIILKYVGDKPASLSWYPDYDNEGLTAFMLLNPDHWFVDEIS